MNQQSEALRERLQWGLRYGRWAAWFTLPAVLVAELAGWFTRPARLVCLLGVVAYLAASPMLSRAYATVRNPGRFHTVVLVGGLIFSVVPAYFTSSLTSPLAF